MEKKKIALLSMDVEEWYHLEYCKGHKIDYSQSTLDGMGIFSNILDKYEIPGTFFVVGSIFDKVKSELLCLIKKGHEIGYHSYKHERISQLDDDEFIKDLKGADQIFNELGIQKMGYRAPCFSLDRAKLDLIIKSNIPIHYDSSFIQQREHPLYTELDLSGFKKINNSLYKLDEFYEFEVSTLKTKKFNIPISGGGYLRILPWLMYKHFLSKYLKNNEFYIFYIHPFELSKNKIKLPKSIHPLNRLRFNLNRGLTKKRIEATIKMLIKKGYEFKTFQHVIEEQSLAKN